MGVFLGAALLAPWLYRACQALAPHSTFCHDMALKPFHRYVTRIAMVVAILGLYPWLKASGVKSPASIGLTSPWGRAGEVWGGIGLGFLSLASVAGLSLLLGARAVNEQMTVGVLWHLSLTALLTAIVIAACEEVLFRGVLFTRLKPEMGVFGALVMSSAVYSIVHFFARTPDPQVVTWSSGLTVLRAMLGDFINPHALFPGFITLFFVGAILAALTQRTGSLYAPMGLHAGWVFWMKMYGAVTHARAGASSVLWGDTKLYDGWVSLGVVLLCGVVVARRGSRPRP